MKGTKPKRRISYSVDTHQLTESHFYSHDIAATIPPGTAERAVYGLERYAYYEPQEHRVTIRHVVKIYGHQFEDESEAKEAVACTYETTFNVVLEGATFKLTKDAVQMPTAFIAHLYDVALQTTRGSLASALNFYGIQAAVMPIIEWPIEDSNSTAVLIPLRAG
ncbi:MAG: hypothetical protein EHM43_05995 [Ignavibacteriae bacterium]|nr:MAG: hypothetical protein EHM43_05995 [Ignavibacteriota bacterium]